MQCLSTLANHVRLEAGRQRDEMVLLNQEKKHERFLMEVQDVFGAGEDGVCVAGKVKSGSITVGEEVEIIGLSPMTKRAMVAAKDQVFPGTLLLQGLTKADLIRGQVLATPGTMKPYTTFWAQVLFSAARARIDPQPFMGTFRSGFHIRSTDIYGTMWLPAGTTLLSPGDQMDVQIELQQPSALEVGLAFHIGRWMGSGTVTRLLG